MAARIFHYGGAEACLLAVADGVGGLPGGETAAELAIGCVDGWLPSGNPEQALTSLVGEADSIIAARANSSPLLAGMATTLVVALISSGCLWIANVGDSRAYVLQGGALRQITRDHSLVAERVQAGLISKTEAANCPQRNVITRSLGAGNGVDVDLFGCGQLGDDDVVLLCSDGLHGMVPDEDIARCLLTLEPQGAARELVRLANNLGGNDNISVAIARIALGSFASREKSRAD